MPASLQTPYIRRAQPLIARTSPVRGDQGKEHCSIFFPPLPFLCLFVLPVSSPAHLFILPSFGLMSDEGGLALVGGDVTGVLVWMFLCVLAYMRALTESLGVTTQTGSHLCPLSQNSSR